MTASARQRSKGVPHWPKRVADSSSCDHELAALAVASGPSCSEEQVEEEAAMPRATSRACARFWSVPRRFPLENRRLPLALPQSFGKLRNSHVSLNPLSVRLFRLATQKGCGVVQKLWRMRIPCGRARKTKN